ncbi:MAG: hypothetical protein PWP51_1971 [Clostridiales bacterium]|jgi:uncharacterized membrane protein YjjB (DUF3815 family)|nr:hypothetical protein [Clostridiales bacterium]MDN5299418.1 hypothetical protein [Clostridiales bacterium]
MYYIQQCFYSLCCVVGFSIIFNLPRKLLLPAGISGMVGWLVYVIIQPLTTSFIMPSLIGSIVVGIIGESFAYVKKHPATMFTIPGIIPFVPGYGIYYTMLHIVEGDVDQALITGAQSLFIAVAIACGIILATTFMRKLKPYLIHLF